MGSINSDIRDIISASIATKQRLLENAELIATLEKVVDVMVDALRDDKKILFCGNGGSAGDAQHIAAELTGRFYKDRDPYFAEALHVNTSYLTAVANDYSYDAIYSRLVKAKGRQGDVLVAISTSGNSGNVVAACKQAREQGMSIVSMTGETGGEMANLTDYLLNVPSTDTPRIQEAHILIGHIMCEFIEIKMEEG